jgi:pimeloyl-ACP methyl ester carboxylesterase
MPRRRNRLKTRWFAKGISGNQENSGLKCGDIFSRSERELQEINVKYLDFYLEAMQAKGLSVPEEEYKDLEENIGGWMVHGMYVSVGINYDYRDFLREVEGPVLVIYGEDDFVPEVSHYH